MRKNILLVAAVLLAVGIIGGATALRGGNSLNQNQSTETQQSGQNNSDQQPNNSGDKNPVDEATGSTQSQTAFTKEELAKFNGKDGSKCYVAVDGKVYEIEQGMLWKDGQHSTSNGQAYCGADMSQVITQSPHGKSKLEQLTVVGTLSQ